MDVLAREGGGVLSDDFTEVVVSHLPRHKVWGFRALQRAESFEQLLLRTGKGADTCPRDSREEDC